MNLAAIGQLLLSVIASVITIAGGYAVAKKFQKMGGGEAQTRLNNVRKELDDALNEKVRLLTEQFDGCKGRLIAMEAQVDTMRKERIEYKQEISELHRQLTLLRRRKVQ